MSEKAASDLRIPDVEIIIQAAASDACTIAFYFPSDVHKAVEVITAVSDPSAAPHLVAILRQAIVALNAENWYTVDELDTRSVSGKDEPPF